MTTQRIYFNDAHGWLKWGKLAGQAAEFKGGVLDTNQSVIIEAARKQLGKQVVQIETLGVVKPLPNTAPPQTLVRQPEPPATPDFIRCGTCGADVHPDEIVSHAASHAVLTNADVKMRTCPRCHEQVALLDFEEHWAGHGRDKPSRKSRQPRD